MPLVAFSPSRPGTPEDLQPFEQLAVRLSSCFSSLQADEVEESLSHALEEVGRTFAVDECTLVAYDGAGSARVAGSWGLPPHPRCTNADIGRMPWLIQRLARNAVTAFTPATDFCHAASADARSGRAERRRGAPRGSRRGGPAGGVRPDGRHPAASRRLGRTGRRAPPPGRRNSRKRAGATAEGSRDWFGAAGTRHRRCGPGCRRSTTRRGRMARSAASSATACRCNRRAPGSSASRRSTPRCCCSARPGPARSCSRRRSTTPAGAATTGSCGSTAPRCREA